MTYEVQLSQVGSKGTVIMETTFGFDFMADALIMEKVKRLPSGYVMKISEARRRVIRAMSPCCHAAYTRAAKNKPLACHHCGAAPVWPEALLDFELSTDYVSAINEFEPLVAHFIPDLLENALISAGLVNALEEVFSSVAEGKRVREVMKLIPQAPV